MTTGYSRENNEICLTLPFDLIVILIVVLNASIVIDVEEMVWSRKILINCVQCNVLFGVLCYEIVFPFLFDASTEGQLS